MGAMRGKVNLKCYFAAAAAALLVAARQILLESLDTLIRKLTALAHDCAAASGSTAMR